MNRLALLLLTLTLGCKQQQAAPSDAKEAPASSAAEKTPDTEHDELPKKIALSDQVLRDAKVQVAPVAREALFETLALPGEIAADPDQLARISSPAAGRIEQVRFKEGAQVKKGDVLVVVRVPEVGRVRSTLLATQGKASAARANAQRLDELLQKRLAAEQDVLNAKAEADSLEVEARSLQEQLGALGAGANGPLAIQLRAPIAGTVLSRDAVVGQPVAPEQTLGSIAKLDELWFLGRVFEKDLGRVALGSATEIRLNAYPAERFAGVIEYVGQQVDPTARAVTARARLKNRDGLLRIGLFGTAEVALSHTEAGPPRLVVPRSAVTEIAGKSVVFVRESPNQFELHEVTLGRAAPGKVEVLEGLGENESIVVDGVFTLKSLVLKGSFAEEEE
ncbi:MAG TPA: efflux RND transporter periplasmic adaptor subunit [Polyangiaceae bacterium]|nr:efflux RND transporter periplasmic adaptor subunit [Polyangiaceae bacterium]